MKGPGKHSYYYRAGDLAREIVMEDRKESGNAERVGESNSHGKAQCTYRSSCVTVIFF